MLRYFGQKMFSNTDSPELVGYELLMREWRGDRWQVPTNFNLFSASEIVSLLARTIEALPNDLTLLSFNLDQAQFVDPSFRQELQKICHTSIAHIQVELTERDDGIDYATLVRAAKDYVNAGFEVVLDDVGTGANQPDLAAAMISVTSEYKFALQNLRHVDASVVTKQAAYWHEQAKRNHKLLTIEGFETVDDLRLTQHFKPDVLQGYYFAHPELIDLPIVLKSMIARQSCQAAQQAAINHHAK